jgi:hypothetical protein
MVGLRVLNIGARLAALCAFVGAGCSSSVRTVPRGPNTFTPVLVTEEPPTTQVERVPPDPGETCAWLDGHWEWGRRGWVFAHGQWVVPPEGCYHAHPVVFWVAAPSGSQLYVKPGGWLPRGEGGTCAAPVVCRADTSRLREGATSAE